MHETFMNHLNVVSLLDLSISVEKKKSDQLFLPIFKHALPFKVALHIFKMLLQRNRCQQCHFSKGPTTITMFLQFPESGKAQIHTFGSNREREHSTGDSPTTE